MNFELNKDVLTLFFEGEINSTNSDKIEKDIEDILAKQSFKTLLLDFSNLTYISSAGLRIVLKLKQTYNDVTVIEASLEVYDIFSMTGFTNFMEVKKALKQVDLSNAEVIGDGFFSTVYRIDKDTIIKVFNRVSDPGQIERELKLAKQAFILGIPTAISFDIVKAGDKLGVRFEMLDCMSLKNMVLAHPEKLTEYVDKYAALLKKITTTECFSPEIPHAKAIYQKKVEVIKPYLDKAHYEKLKKIIDNIEDRNTFVHGDCHFKNIMVQKDELILIDMDTLSIGHPIFEFAGIYCPYVAFDEDDPGNTEKFFGMKSEDAHRLYNALVNRYFGSNNQEVKEKIQLVAYTHMIWWNRTNEPENKKRLEGCKSRLLPLLDKYNDVNV